MERFVIIWAKLRGGPADRVGVRFAYGWPRLKRFEINAVLNIMAQVWLVYIVRCRRREECDLLEDLEKLG